MTGACRYSYDAMLITLDAYTILDSHNFCMSIEAYGYPRLDAGVFDAINALVFL
jgi:hypothetical protein